MIDVTRPVPCRKFASVPLEAQMKKIHSEVGEAWEALNRNRGMIAGCGYTRWHIYWGLYPACLLTSICGAG